MEKFLIGMAAIGVVLLLATVINGIVGGMWAFVLWLGATYLLPVFGYSIALSWWQWWLAGFILACIANAIKPSVSINKK